MNRCLSFGSSTPAKRWQGEPLKRGKAAQRFETARLGDPACFERRHATVTRLEQGGEGLSLRLNQARAGRDSAHRSSSVFVNKHQLALTLYPLAIDMLYSKCSSIFCHATRLIGLRARRVRIARDHKHKQNIELMKHSYFSFLCSFIFFNRTANR